MAFIKLSKKILIESCLEVNNMIGFFAMQFSSRATEAVIQFGEFEVLPNYIGSRLHHDDCVIPRADESI